MTKYKKGFVHLAFIAIGVLVLIIVAGTVATVMKNKSEYKEQISVSKNITNNKTKDWKTYRNEKYGFEFKYPKNFIVGDDSHNPTGQFDLDLLVTQFDQLGNPVMNNRVFVLKDLEWDSKKMSFAEIIESLHLNSQTKNYSESLVGKYKIARFNSSYFIISDGSHAVLLTFNPDFLKNYQYVESFISNFKFLDQQSSINNSTWKTYRNEKYEYTVKFPNNLKIHEPKFEKGENFSTLFLNKDIYEAVNFYVSVIPDNFGNKPSYLISNYLPAVDINKIYSAKVGDILDFKWPLIFRKIEDEVVDGYKGVSIEGYYDYNPKNTFENGRRILIKKDGYTYIIGTPFRDDFKFFLSTFKFIDKSDQSTADWKTYREKEYNEKYRFEFKYPKNWFHAGFTHDGSANTFVRDDEICSFSFAYGGKGRGEDETIGFEKIVVNGKSTDLIYAYSDSSKRKIVHAFIASFPGLNPFLNVGLSSKKETDAIPNYCMDEFKSILQTLHSSE